MLGHIIDHRGRDHMHKPPFLARTRLPARERLRLANRGNRKALCTALLCAVPLLYLLGEVLFAQP